MFDKVWNQVRKEPTVPYGHRKRLLEGGKDYDPCKLAVWRRWLRGLAGLSGV